MSSRIQSAPAVAVWYSIRLQICGSRVQIPVGDSKKFILKKTNLLYINSKSNHPPTILKNIPEAVNDRLCRLSSSKEEFMARTEALASQSAAWLNTLSTWCLSIREMFI